MDRRQARRRAAAEGVARLIETITGVRPTGCPWRGYYDRECIEVLHAFAWWDKSQSRELLGDDPEAWMLEAIDVYRRVLSAVRNDVIDQDRREFERRAKGGGAPPGWSVEGGGHG